MSRFLKLLDSSSAQTGEDDKNDKSLRLARSEVRPKRQKPPLVVSGVLVVSAQTENGRGRERDDQDFDTKDIKSKVDTDIITTDIHFAPKLYDKNDKNDKSPPCSLCGKVIAERLPTSWGGDAVHRACGERAFAEAKAAKPAVYRHWLE